MTLAIPLDSTVLVTGINGFIGSHVADQLLVAGYRVRGTARTASKADGLKAFWDGKYGPGKAEIVEVPDLAAKGGLDEAVKGVSGICHVAMNMTWTPDPNALIPESIAAMTEILRVAKAEPSVKRFVYTASIVTVSHPIPGKEFSVDGTMWNEASTEKAWATPPYTYERSPHVYATGKVVAEQALWKFVKEEKPDFVVNSLLPNINYGPALDPSQPSSTTSQGSSYNMVRMLFNGVSTVCAMFPPRNLAFLDLEPDLRGVVEWFINVQDHARLHVAALTNPEVANERIFAMAQPFNWNDVMGALHKARPDRKFIEDFTDEKERDLMKMPNQRGAELLKGMGRAGYTSLEESVADNVKDL